MASQITMTVWREEERTLLFRLLDKATKAGIDLTGKTVTLTVRLSLDDAVEIQLVPGAGITYRNQATYPGELYAVIASGDTTGLDICDHVWDLWLDDQVVVAPSIFRLERSVREA